MINVGVEMGEVLAKNAYIYILYKRSFEKFFSFAYQTDKKKKSP